MGQGNEQSTNARETRHVVERRPDVLDLVIVEVKILDRRQRAEYFWVEVGDEVLPQT